MRNAVFALVCAALIPAVCSAGPVSGRVRVVEVRPYMPNAVFIGTDNPHGSFCYISYYQVSLTTEAGRAIHAAALAALLSGKPVQLEAASCGVSGSSYPTLQSLYVFAN